jgi:hypothetical protein
VEDGAKPELAHRFEFRSEKTFNEVPFITFLNNSLRSSDQKNLNCSLRKFRLEKTAA